MAAVVLAAGKSSRFGSDKRLNILSSGVPMAVQSILNLTALGIDVFVVIKPEDRLPECFKQCVGVKPPPKTVHWVTCEDHALGMGHSLSCGAQAVDQAGFDACLVALADMPFIQVSTLEMLVQFLAAGHSLVRPTYKSTPGHPVGFARKWFPKLISSTGDEGAKPWLKAFAHQMKRIEVHDPGVLKDIDRMSDFD
ncbi:MAG: nucleotidyltransferase family protein [Limnobacter sp.]|nr:nucleotidyltransferase family protein [Limnobacter sp.]